MFFLQAGSTGSPYGLLWKVPPNFKRIKRRKQLFELKIRACYLSLIFALSGIMGSILEAELCSNNYTTKVRLWIISWIIICHFCHPLKFSGRTTVDDFESRYCFYYLDSDGLNFLVSCHWDSGKKKENVLEREGEILRVHARKYLHKCVCVEVGLGEIRRKISKKNTGKNVQLHDFQIFDSLGWWKNC